MLKGRKVRCSPLPLSGRHDLASLPDFCSFYNILKTCRGHTLERSVFSERTEESSAVQYFQVGTWRLGQLCRPGGPRGCVASKFLSLALPLAQGVTLDECPVLAWASVSLICETEMPVPA